MFESLEAKKRIYWFIGGGAGLLLLGIFLGWFIFTYRKGELVLNTLRLHDFDLVSPLLICDTQAHTSLKDSSLRNLLNDMVDTARKNRTVESASIYIRKLKTGDEIEINPEEKYYPASLRKIPVLMVILKMVEINPNYLDEVKIRVVGTDLNKQQEIRPEDPVVPGMSYSLRQLVEKMIVYSDNNAAEALVAIVNENNIKKIYQDLTVPLTVVDEHSSKDEIDFVTARQFSLFLRVLFNATYLNSEQSEKAMELLTETKFKQGLVAGVPAGVRVAHKFGLFSVLDPVTVGQVNSRQLHDCGIVYKKNDPYLLCVMTKSNADLPTITGFIKNISETVYSGMEDTVR